MRLKDKVIIVTGSTTGIGKAIAMRCVGEGAKVVLHGLEEDLGAEVLQEIGTEHAVFHCEDITTETCPDNLVRLAMDTFGKLDAVVNNAALVIASDIHNTDRAFFQKVLDINTIAPFLLIQKALPELIKTRGSVLNIGSINAWSGEPNLLAYSVSKGAIMTLTGNLGDSLMREYGVRVNQINPGWVLTERETERKKLHGLSENWYEELPSIIAPSGRILWPAEIAAACIFWLSDESGPVSGQVLTLEQHPMIGRNLPKDNKTFK
ncbi:MAG: SDR family oxidoreductase [Algoriphagus sp.]|uniref:SDR family NAD(P)-dependent oxidoreductase n=1 Tax=Algoriphagus sp. TaxID=1872435 RepID=UPI0027304BC6|nr:SDR family oxidoreductase [Algoriphagus sp.]MDP2042058.1 SDR family oxidoreductase [Algoriphagus sp.]MDP3474095.1 SDR family oxidoreductase [Algoriphagus sp.]